MNTELLKRLNLLIVDDSPEILNQIKIVLEDFCKEIQIADDGSKAIKILEEGYKADVILTDILMPELNGLEMIKKIKGSNIDVETIIVISAHNEANYLLEAIKLKVDGYLLKPLDLDELIDTILRSVKPKMQERELQLVHKIFEAMNVFIGGKKIEIIRYIYENTNEEGYFLGSYEDIMQALNVSKPTVVNAFKQLTESGLIVREKYKHYKIIGLGKV